MASFKNMVLVVLIAVAGVSFYQTQAASLDLDEVALRLANWTDCDITTDPVLSCLDCNTRLICKPIGGLTITCLNPYRPYCVNGICSPIPSEGCASEGEGE